MPPSPAEYSRPHYQGLDFLRGVAAIAVVGFHFSSRLDLPNLFYHGYLGVDFFFVLSGFVIAHAYGARLASGAINPRAFIVLRLVRLLPMVAFGTVLAAFVDVLRPGQFSMAQHLADIAVALVMGCLCLPTLWHTTLEPTVFPLNSPVWSLFFELVANACCIPLYRSRQAGLVLRVALAISLVAITWAVLAQDSANLGSIPADFWLGFPRVAWSFWLGLLLSQVPARAIPLSKWAYAVILAAVLACPELPPGASGLFDLAAIGIVFPLIVLGAAHCSGAERRSSLSAWSGNMSYPLYATHYPLVRAMGLVGRKVSDTAAAHGVVAVLGTLALVGFATAVYTHFDVPVRRWIATWLKARRPDRKVTVREE